MRGLQAGECRAQYQVQRSGLQMRKLLQPDVSEECFEGLRGRHLGCVAVLDDSVAVGCRGRVGCSPDDVEATAGKIRGRRATETRRAGAVEYLDRDLRRRDVLDLDLRGLGQLRIVRDRAEKLIRPRLHPM